MIAQSDPILALCLVVATLALGGVCTLLGLLVWRRLARTDHETGFEIARMMIEAHNAASARALQIAQDSLAEAATRAEARKESAQWRPNPQEDNPREGETVHVAGFKDAPLDEPIHVREG